MWGQTSGHGADSLKSRGRRPCQSRLPGSPHSSRTAAIQVAAGGVSRGCFPAEQSTSRSHSEQGPAGARAQSPLCWLPHSVSLGTWSLLDTCPALPPTLDSGPSLSLAGVSGLLLPKSEGWGSHSGGEPREPAGGAPAGAGNSFLSARVWPGPLLPGTRLPPEEAWRWALAEPGG